MTDAGLLTIATGEVDLWITFLDPEPGAALLADQRSVLSGEELDRASRFVFEKHRRDYITSHALVRETLSRYAPVAPSAWTFTSGPRGRPEIADELGTPWLRFN